MNQAKCTTCGAGLTIKQGDKTCVCAYCQSTNIVENALALGKVEVDVTEDIKKLRANLTTFVQQNSIDEILRVSQKLLDWIPQDFVALYFFGYAKQQQNQPRFLYDFYREPPVFTDVEFEFVVDHIIHKSELRDKRRIVHWFESFEVDLVQRYLTVHKEREDQENNYANVPRDVFICFSSYNIEIAEKVVEELEADGNTCWISSRNLRPNDTDNYWKNIENAIINTSIFFVVSSVDSMLSKDVHQEIDYAIKTKKRIIEFKIDEVPHNTLFKHVFDGNKWIKGTSNHSQSYDHVLQRIYEEIYNLRLLSREKIEDKKIEKTNIIDFSPSQNSLHEDEQVASDQESLASLNYNDYEIERFNELLLKGDIIIDLQSEGGIAAALSLSGSLFVWGRVEILAGVDERYVHFPLNVTDNLNLRNDEFIKSFHLGNEFIGILTSKSRIYMFGSNTYGQIGCGERKLDFQEALYDKKILPIDITDNFNLAMGDNIINLSLGHSGASALSSVNEIYLWGKIYGIVDDRRVSFNNPKNVTKFIELSKEDSISLMTPYGLVSALGRIFIWSGRIINSSSSLINSKPVASKTVIMEPKEMTDRFNLAKNDYIIKLEVGNACRCALTHLGKVFTWGSNNYGQLGTGTYVSSDELHEITHTFNLEEDDKIIGVSVGRDHLLAFSMMNRVFSWGANHENQLGFRTNTTFFNRNVNLNTPYEITINFKFLTVDKILTVVAGHSNSKLLTSSGRVFSWGSGGYGMGGNGENHIHHRQPITEITSNFKLM